MKCHYERCQKLASPNWPYFTFAAPLCDEHADIICAMVPLPNVRADDLIAENDRLFQNIAKASSRIRSDYEWDAYAPDRRPELQ